MHMPFEHPPNVSCEVAVIGAGASGLVAARELRREGHKVVVFERGGQVGGAWVYTPEVESDAVGLDPNRTVVHSSLYESFRTNLPRELMGFRDYPFLVKKEEGRDPRRFPGHREVLMYLKDFAEEFGVGEVVRLETEVVYVGMVESQSGGLKWKVRSRKRVGGVGVDDDEVFDAVVVCVGHYWEPHVAEIPGINAWPGKQMHSHSYRVPEPFRDKVVILIGSSASAVDISGDIAGVAKEVHIASRSVADGITRKKNLWLHSMIRNVHEDGSVVFEDGSIIIADFILHCTGYNYSFPFLDTNGIVTVEDDCVRPLYKHVFPPALSPWLSFIGLAWKVVPFPAFELQGKWIAGVLSNRIALPSREEMTEDVKAFYSSLEASGKPMRYTHDISDYQFEYIDWLIAQCGCQAHEEWRKQMLIATLKNMYAPLVSHRDDWEDHDLVLKAQEDFLKFI